MFSTARLARTSARHPWLILLLWVLLIVGAGVAQGGMDEALSGEDELTNNPDSRRGAELLEDRLRGPDANTETVIVRSDTLTVDDPAFQTAVEATTGELRGFSVGVTAVANYYDAVSAGDPAAERLVSDDRHNTIIPVTLAGDDDALDTYAEDYVALIERLGTDGFEVLSVGSASSEIEFSKIVEEDVLKGEMVGIPTALIVLIVVFGALVAAGVPLILALVSIFVSLGLTALIGQVFPFTDLVVNVITMIGLAVGIDYALFVVERYREERRRGTEKRAAIERAGATASKAVVFSGFTVIIALMGMLLIPVTVFRSMGIGAALVVLVAIVANLTLVPAILSLLGDKIDWPRRRRQTAAPETAHDPAMIYNGFWGRITRIVIARPAVSAILATTLLVGAAISVRDLNTGQTGMDSLPDGDVKTAYEVLATEFYAGVIAPVEIVVDGTAADPEVEAGVQTLVAVLGEDPNFGPATVTTNDAGDLTLISAPLSMDSSTPAAEAAVDTLRDETIPAAFAGSETEIYVTGEAAFSLDFNNALTDYMPLVFAFVLGLSFLLLVLAFRSIVVPLKAIVLNLLSVGAAYGLLVLVFQKGIGADLFGFQETPVITAWIPLFLFCILFGLSMDYHVFLLSRIREHYDLTKKNGESVAFGLHATAKIITGAALIMVAVFGGFASGRLVDMQQMGFGLAAAVLIDATIVRSILVPASMALLGHRNWYLPRWLEWLPDLRVEGRPDVDPAGAVPRAAPAGGPLAGVPVTAMVNARPNRFLQIVEVPFEGRTYRSLGYLLTALPLGIAYFTSLIVGFAVGFGAFLALFGIPILLLTVGLAWKLMSLERRLAGAVLGEEIPPPFTAGDRAPTFWARIKARLLHPATYKGIAFLFAKLPLGIFSFTSAIVAVSLPIALLASMLTFPFAEARPELFRWEVDTIQEALACGIATPLVLLATLHILNGLAELCARLARGAVGGAAPLSSAGD